MLKHSDLKVIVGLGKTGLSCVHYLKSQGAHVAVIDSRLNPPAYDELRTRYPDVLTSLGKFDEELLSRACEIIISPGVSLKEPAIAKQAKRQVPILGDVELFAQKTTKPVVAITGSNGKSTVTSLVGHLAAHAGLKVKVGGNLGTPVLDLFDDATTEMYVLELSSFQLETTYSLNALTAVNLNISPDHMDRYNDLQEYIQAKIRVYSHCANPIVNLDDPQSFSSAAFKNDPLGFTLKEPKRGEFGIRKINKETFLAWGEENLLSTRLVTLKGQHQYANILASLALGRAMGLSMDIMLEGLLSFKGLPHRCQWLANYRGVDWYNDSKATNVGSLQAAILGIGPEIQGKLVLLAGGQGKNADFRSLFKPVADYVRTLILFGQDKNIIAEALNGAAPIRFAKDLNEAAQIAEKTAVQGDAVLLSPACASFDMFQNFEHRGETFIEIVRGMFP